MQKVQRPLFRQSLAPYFVRRTSSSQQFRRDNHRFISAVLTGVAAGGTLAAAGYAWYHFSGTKNTVDTVNSAILLLGKSKEKVATHSTNQALGYLRQACKTYLAHIPFSALFIDRTFDSIDEVIDPHLEAANIIVRKASDDILQIVQRGGDVFAIISTIRKLLSDLTAVGIKTGNPIVEHLNLKRKLKTISGTSKSVFDSMKENIGEKIANIRGKSSSSAPTEVEENAKK